MPGWGPVRLLPQKYRRNQVNKADRPVNLSYLDYVLRYLDTYLQYVLTSKS